MADGNGKFLRGVFWALLIGSFGWATFIGITGLAALNSHCAEAKTEMTTQKNDYISRDEFMLRELTKEFKEINNSMSEQHQDILWIKEKISKI